jgi:hypothetical protein
MLRRATFPIALVATLSGCQTLGGVQLMEVATASGKPSNVATMVTVTQHRQPVSSLGPAAFRLSENGQALDSQMVGLKLIDPTRVAAFHTVLLLDLSHTATNEDRQQLGEAVGYFIRGVRAKQSVTVLGFDGSPKTRLIGEFPVDRAGGGSSGIDKQLPAKLDPSRDLRGAVVQALDLLDRRLEKSARPVQLGTLVVFSRGPDVAGRVTVPEFEARLRRSHHRMVLVNVVGDRTDDQSTALAEDGQIQATAAESLPIAFEQAASTVDRLLGHYYVVSYCSPARGGSNRLRVAVQVVNDDLQVVTDEFDTNFNASGFTGGCDSSDPPHFDRVKGAGFGGAKDDLKPNLR